MADLKLIKISKKKSHTDFSALLEKLRTQGTEELSFDVITQEVEEVRKKRYE